MADRNKENEGVVKAANATSGYNPAFHDPEPNCSNAWRIYRCVCLCTLVFTLSTSARQHNLLSRNKNTYGRWYRFDGKARFITGIPPLTGHAFKQPVLELYSWKEFFTNRRLVLVAL